MVLRTRVIAVLAATAVGATLTACGGDGESGTTPGETTTSGPVAEGRAVFIAQGCGSCHELDAADTHGTVGPDLGSALAGKERAFIIESIVDPNAKVRSGYPRNTMPRNYSEQLSEQELNALVEFLAASTTAKR